MASLGKSRKWVPGTESFTERLKLLYFDRTDHHKNFFIFLTQIWFSIVDYESLSTISNTTILAPNSFLPSIMAKIVFLVTSLSRYHTTVEYTARDPRLVCSPLKSNRGK